MLLSTKKIKLLTLDLQWIDRNIIDNKAIKQGLSDYKTVIVLFWF